MTATYDDAGRIASLEGALEATKAENAALRAQIKHLAEFKDTTRRYLLGHGETVAQACRELHKMLNDERKGAPNAAQS